MFLFLSPFFCGSILRYFQQVSLQLSNGNIDKSKGQLCLPLSSSSIAFLLFIFQLCDFTPTISN
jgi:hypothetical protein